MSEVNFGGGYSYEEEEEGQGGGDEGENELEIDDSLAPIDRLQKYVHSDLVLHRLHVVRELDEVVSQNWDATKDKVLPLLPEIVEDAEPVIRQALAEQLQGILILGIQKGEGEGLLQAALPVLERLLRDGHAQVRASAGETAVAVWEQTAALQDPPPAQLDQDLVGRFFVPLVEKLGKDDEEEEHRVEAADLVARTASLLPHSCPTVAERLLEAAKELGRDVMFRVRKAAAAALALLAGQVGAEQVGESVLPAFLGLAHDEIWGVRKACAEAFVELSKATPPPHRSQHLSGCFLALIQDPSRWVRNSAFQNLGPFIATFGDNKEYTVSSELLEHYCSMVEGSNNKYGDSDTVMYCAFSFPGVLLTIGKDKWDQLKEVYNNLVKNLQWKVRRTLSHSLHEVAALLGQELTEANLLETFEMFMKDLDQVKVGVVKHLAKFLAVLSPQTRLQYVRTIEEIQAESVNWRFRKLIAKQLGPMAELYDTETVERAVLPVALGLCEDGVTSVRQAAAKAVGELVGLIGRAHPSLLQPTVRQLLQFAERQSCYDRQTFALIAESIVGRVDAAAFKEFFLPRLLALSTDRVPNVRFVVSRAITEKLLPNPDFEDSREKLRELQAKFRQDVDREVRFFSYPDGQVNPLSLPRGRRPDPNDPSAVATSASAPIGTTGA